MSLLDTASLIVTPNGYKEGKLYSVIPSDGSGDLSVTRATTATRVNSAGLVELVPYNLFSYSQNLANGSWSTYAASGTITRTANYGVAPDGTNTATRIQNSGGDPIQWTYQNILMPSNGIISMYVKRTGTSNQTFRFFSNNGATFSSNFTATDTWQRFDFAVGSNTGALPFGITTDSSGTAADILVWGAQLVEGSVAKDYQKTETRLNIPRLDYSNGTCPSILVEPQRTNLITYSEQFNQWSPQAIGTASLPVVTANAATAPNGLQVADKIVFNSGSGTGAFDWSFIISNSFSTSAASYTGSIYLKGENGGEQIQIRHAASGSYTKLTLTTEWQRFDTIETGTGGSANMELAIRRDLNEPMNATATIYAWAAQEELGSYATSYIPTTSASVTRNADVISKTGISSLIGQTEGTCFVDFNYDNSTAQGNPILFSFRNTAWTSEVYAQFLASGGIQVQTYLGGVQQSYLFYSGVTNGHHKIAYAYKQNDFVLYVDGVQVATDTSGNVPTTDDFCLGYFNTAFTPSANYNATALWKTRLTNTQLAQLTTI